MSEQSLTITDDRTGKSYKLPIENGTVRAMDLRQIKTDADDFGLMTYDPALMNTASTKSAITFIDGDKGILEYRGYPVEQLAERSNFLEVAYLILFGELPNEDQLAAWTYDITHHTFVHENIKTLMQAFRYDAHPMGMFISTVAALSTFYPDANKVSDADNRLAQIKRLIAKVPTIAAYTYRHNRGLRYIYPDNDLSYTGNFLNMMFKLNPKAFVKSQAITVSHSLSRSSPTGVFQNSNKYPRRASVLVSPASASVPEPSLGLRQERYCLSHRRIAHRRLR